MKVIECPQLTLRGLLEVLDAHPQHLVLKMTGFSMAENMGQVFRHRPYVDGLAIEPAVVIPKYSPETTVGDYAAYLRRSAPGLVWGDKKHFKDPYPGSLNSPMWVSLQRDLSFNAVTGVDVVRGFALLRWVNMAPVQGPSLQRISDAEMVQRMRIADATLHGEAKALDPKAERFLIRYVAKERSAVLSRLEWAREDLASFDASLQAKRDLVAELELEAAHHDYLLGIRDDFPG